MSGGDDQDQRLRIAIEHAIDDAVVLAGEVRGISSRIPISDQGHVHHLRSIADRLDKLAEALGLELRSPIDIDREGSRALAIWGRRLGTGALATIALIGHGGITRTSEVAAEYFMRTAAQLIETAEEPTSPSEKLALELLAHRQAANMTATELAQQLGVSRQYISALENGRSIPSEEALHKLFEILQMDPSTRELLSQFREEARRVGQSDS